MATVKEQLQLYVTAMSVLGPECPVCGDRMVIELDEEDDQGVYQSCTCLRCQEDYEVTIKRVDRTIEAANGGESLESVQM